MVFRSNSDSTRYRISDLKPLCRYHQAQVGTSGDHTSTIQWIILELVFHNQHHPLDGPDISLPLR